MLQPFARWIIKEKRRRRPQYPFVLGVHGSIGQGKTVFSRALAHLINRIIANKKEAAVVLSLDDYYLPKVDRYKSEFLAKGYNPPGIPNRGPAGTHDVERLWADMKAMDAGQDSFEFPMFSKVLDDRLAETRHWEGHIEVLILEGWFVGAQTQIDFANIVPGLKRSVAEALPRYRPIFERLDALWAFAPPSKEDILRNRLEQEETLHRQTGRVGMTPEQIRRFVEYFYVDAWQEGVTSPYPPPDCITFLARTNAKHRFVGVEPSWP